MTRDLTIEEIIKDALIKEFEDICPLKDCLELNVPKNLYDAVKDFWVEKKYKEKCRWKDYES